MWVCDLEKDCEDNSDEEIEECKKGQSHCTYYEFALRLNVSTFSALIGWFIRAGQSERRTESRSSFDYFKRKANSDYCKIFFFD
ncbi:hypothetical protein SFRURICE_003616 [Spodoptera frugiperda]|nr:hypothetical protein SFRURICE_003616 [Spodoptera frugiperda]